MTREKIRKILEQDKRFATWRTMAPIDQDYFLDAATEVPDLMPGDLPDAVRWFRRGIAAANAYLEKVIA